MQLFRTVCQTNWKCQPHHILTLIAISTKARLGIVAKSVDEKLLQLAMNDDVRKWMAVDIAADEFNKRQEAGDPVPDGCDLDRAAELEKLQHAGVRLLWENSNRYERRPRGLHEGGVIHREFAEKTEDGDRCTTVYHFLD